MRGKNGLGVSDTGYWLYCNADKAGKAFDKKLEFELTLIEEKIDDKWVEPTLLKIKKTLEGNMPENSPTCEFCTYARSRTQLTLDAVVKKK